MIVSKKERVDGAAHGQRKVPQLECTIGLFFSQQCDGKNRKRRVCERLDRGNDRVCAQFGKTEKKRGVKKKPCVCVVSRGAGGVGQTARN